MANLPETPTWEEGIFQLETTTPALGGVDGPANTQAKQLANRTAYLKTQVDALRLDLTSRDVVMRDDQGLVHHMVWVPRFRVSALSLVGGSWPPSDLELGGFFVDKYVCSHPAATPLERGIGDDATVEAESTEDIAQSRPGLVPWTHIQIQHAATACANRTFAGRPCHMVSMEEWGALLLLMQSNPQLRGNNGGGHDSRDPDVWEYRGVPDPTAGGDGRMLPGTGPVTWAHNGAPSGVWDLIGNVPEMVYEGLTATKYRHELPARLTDTDGISDVDTTIVIDRVKRVDEWPSSGLIYITAPEEALEYVRYASIVDNEDGTWVLTGCVRGQKGTSAAAHSMGSTVMLRVDYCLLPGGGSGVLAATSALNDTDDESTFSATDLVFGPPRTELVEGDVLDIQGERLLVTDVVPDGDGWEVTATRGHAGTVKATHAAGMPLAVLSDYLDLDLPEGYQTGWIHGLRSEPHLRRAALPGQAYSYSSGGLPARVIVGLATQTVVVRGGWPTNAVTPATEDGWDWACMVVNGTQAIGFRAAWRLDEEWTT